MEVDARFKKVTDFSYGGILDEIMFNTDWYVELMSDYGCILTGIYILFVSINWWHCW